jgi:condensin-2 complex subunit G2
MNYHTKSIIFQVVDVKRLWSVRQTLLLMDFEDESCCSLKASLLQCLIHPVFLKVEEVRRHYFNTH